ncbi:gluconate 2-dehydrogenase subunit 3 family protein [Paraburkholderia susongensis]|uniref:Gluconate 2-dehydrogenase gamma chain n=1 Tax=Paraburkholderia susongensis TaxID=1515439 RepID=A0A1X7L7F3_9BURK|nr:gluconate 2-dehydrogenase subunit 3 family protein [Paraburkholderia susongensis]SMG49680.1 gluconate 2-dehydrogenase gamma chain [Paraburkholderia susongensis]
MLLFAATVVIAKAKVIYGGMPWVKDPVVLPEPVTPDGWKYFTADEAAAVEAIADRLIPHDEISIGGKEAGCALFIDRQLSGDYGKAITQYRLGSVTPGTPQQGPQFSDTPAQRYRAGLGALDAHCKKAFDGKAFAALSADQQDALLTQIESGELALEAVDSQAFFNMLLQNVREGFFADPIYGGNKNMAGWKMLGFPGAQYDFRDVIGRRGEDLKIIPISLINRKS